MASNAALYAGGGDEGATRSPSPVNPRAGNGDSGTGDNDRGYGGGGDNDDDAGEDMTESRMVLAADSRLRLLARQRVQLSRESAAVG